MPINNATTKNTESIENTEREETTEQGLHARFHLQHPQSRFALNVDLILPDSGVTAIFGESGSGKTTLLRCIAGLERAQQGHFVMKGETWQSDTIFLPTHKRSLGYVFQEPSLFPHLTAKGNLDYAIKRSGIPLPANLYDQVIDLMGIESVMANNSQQLSGGEKQRVAIARALLIQPTLLLMDEPLASLDNARKQKILPYLEKLRSTLKTPILYVSHSVEEVMRLADHIVLMQDGEVATQGQVEDVFSQLNSPLLVNNDTGVIWQGKIIEQDDKWHLSKVSCAGSDLWIRNNGDSLGKNVRVRILATDVSLTLTYHEDSSILNRLPVSVLEIVPDKDPAMALVRLQTEQNTLIARLTYRSVEHLALTEGKTLWAQIKSVALVR
jgi:molybdate transport system ATP-binding protein